MSANELIGYLRDKRVLILGFGREGKSTYRFLRKYLPEKQLTIGDRNAVSVDDARVDYDCGEDYLRHFDRYDVVVKSPGIPFLDVTWPETTEITCQLDLFLRYTDGVTVGVTGTKGKTTTSTLTHRILKCAGLNACLIGNMGVPVFDDFEAHDDQICVIEMSSHQLEFTRKSPHVAVITNLYEEHLDHYRDGFTGYVNAKLNIARHQKSGDFFIYNGTQGLAPYLDVNALAATAIPVFAQDETALRLCAGNPHLPGAHNAFDAALAIAAAKCLGAEEAAAEKALASYEGIPNRMEYFGTYGGVRYYNDAIATVPAAVQAAVDALGDVGTLIIGGQDRGIDYSGFIAFLQSAGLDNVVCLPDTGYLIGKRLLADGCGQTVYLAADLPDAVRWTVSHTQPGKSCILSPAAASYNVYRDFEEKGAHFKALVRDAFDK